jgi:hypothetical protein
MLNDVMSKPRLLNPYLYTFSIFTYVNPSFIIVSAETEYFSVTFGALGTTQEATLETVLDIQKNDTVAAAPHLGYSVLGELGVEFVCLLLFVGGKIRNLFSLAF